jgi:DegV family protein with EDD domain
VEDTVSVRIVVDSTADIPPDRAQSLGITVVPLMVLFGDEAYRDGMDLDGPAFYAKLSASRVLPTTSAPAPGLFDAAYRGLIAEGATGILSIHLAAKLSATFASAHGVAATVSQETGVPIELVDSETVSAGFGLPAEMVAREAQEGKSLAELKAHAESLCRRTHIIAVLDTLEYLQRGGRIGRAKRLLGTLLNVKPLIGVRESEVIGLEQPRTRAKGYERIAQLTSELGELEALAIVEGDETSGSQLEPIIRRVWSGPIERFVLGAVVGTHGGPGAAGVAAITRAE